MHQINHPPERFNFARHLLELNRSVNLVRS